MTSRWAAGACFFVALSGCASEPSVAWDSAAAPERAAQAEVELRAFGKGRFEVLSFHCDPESSEYLHPTKDRYLYVSRHFDLYRLAGPGRERFDFSADLFRGGEPHSELFHPDHAHLHAPGHDLLAKALHREIMARDLLGN